jgi:HAMP domain-containing protein
MKGRIEELKDEIKDLIERQEAVKDPVEKMVYQDLIAEKGAELEDLEREFGELARQYV